MTLPDEIRRELFDLCWTLQDGSFSPADVERLERLAKQYPEVHALYAKYMVMCGALQWERKEEESRTSGQWPVAGGQYDEYPPSALRPPPSIIPPIIVDPSPTLHSPLGGFLLSHLAAAVILGIGLLIGLAWRISLPTSERQEPGGTGYASVVGRITALADCKARQWSVASGQWSEITNHKLEIINHKFFLGDRFVLSTGLMEIAYDTGAKVILEGPCTYEIDSKRGGYLAVGKLTARIVASGQWPVASKTKQKKHEAESLTTGHRPLATALFAVRTPTAMVTDLGTEFGVEVEESGATRSHVFQGSVELVASGQWPVASERNSRGSTTPGASREILHAGESACVERGRNRKVIITHEPGQPDRFVRQISISPNQQISKSLGATGSASAGSPPMSPEAYADYVLSLRPAAYYRMELPKSKKNRLVVFDSAPGGHHGEFRSMDTSVTPYTAGRFGDAMSFRGNRVGDYVMLPPLPSAQSNPLTVVAWVMLTHPQPEPLAVFGRWGSPHRNPNMPGVFHFIGSGAPEPLHRWHHMAYVITDESDETVVRMYQDGIETNIKHTGHVWPKLYVVFWSIGGVEHRLVKEKVFQPLYWQGQIDEVAIFNKVLPAETIEQLYLGGAAAAKGGHQ